MGLLTVSPGYATSEILTDDFNQDGNADLTLIVYQGRPGGGGVLLYTGNGDGTFASNLTVVEPNNDGYGGVYADVNGDGIPDLITSGLIPGLSVILGTGKGGFATPIDYFFHSGGSPLFSGKFLGDNTLSIVGFTDLGGGTALFMNQGGTALAVTSSAPSATIGQSVSFTATLIPTLSGRPKPTGTVTYYDGSALMGSGAVGTPLATTQLSIGSHIVTAAYGGDANFNPNISAPITVRISVPAPDFTIGPSASTLSVTKGQSGSLTLTIAPNASLNAAVSFECTGLPSESTCTFMPTSLSVAAGSSGTATMIISTKAAASSRHLEAQNSLKVLEGIAGVGLLFFLPRKRGRWMTVVSLVAIVVLAGLSGCSGGSSVSTTPPDPGTSIGTTNITVTATAVSGSTTVKHATTIVLSVQ